MQIIITGGGGFLGQKLASALLNSSLAFNELLLVDLKCLHGYQTPLVYAAWKLT